MTDTLVAPLKTHLCPSPKHYAPFPRRSCRKGYVRVNKTQLKKTLWKITMSSYVCHTLLASLVILEFSSMGPWNNPLQPPPPCHYRYAHCCDIMYHCPSASNPLSSCCAVSFRYKVDGLGNQLSQMRHHIL
jgi:hypothetical protein